MRMSTAPLTVLLVTATLLAPLQSASPLAAAGPATDEADVECELEFTLKGWSAFYKTARGTGVVTCDNGQRADVKIKVTGGGVTFGKTEIHDGIGTFSDVLDIEEIFGSYASAGASAGAVKASEAAAMTKGEVSLAIAGTGRGWDIGLSGAKFTIRRR